MITVSEHFDLIENGAVKLTLPILPVEWEDRRIRREHKEGKDISPWCKREKVPEPEFYRSLGELVTNFEIVNGKTRQKHELVDHPLEDAKKYTLAMIEEQHEQFIAYVTGNPSEREMATWGKKLEEARLVQAGETDPLKIPFVTKRAARTGETPSQISASIMAKNDAYTEILGDTDGFRKVLKTAVNAATTVDEIRAALNASKIEKDQYIANLV